MYLSPSTLATLPSAGVQFVQSLSELPLATISSAHTELQAILSSRRPTTTTWIQAIARDIAVKRFGPANADSIAVELLLREYKRLENQATKDEEWSAASQSHRDHIRDAVLDLLRKMREIKGLY
jgi:hypothetical protein